MSKVHAEDYYLRVLFEKTKISEIMKTQAPVIHEFEDCSKAHRMFVTDHLSHIIIIDDNNEVVGLISPKFLYRAQSPTKVMEGQVVNLRQDIREVQRSSRLQRTWTVMQLRGLGSWRRKIIAEPLEVGSQK